MGGLGETRQDGGWEMVEHSWDGEQERVKHQLGWQAGEGKVPGGTVSRRVCGIGW